MRVKDLLSPFDGLFANMPQDIWEGELDPQFMDVDLIVNCGDLDASPLLRFFYDGSTTDVEALAAGIYSKYKHNWQAMWDAVHAEYDVMITSTMDTEVTTTYGRKDELSFEDRKDVDAKSGIDKRTMNRTNEDTLSFTDRKDTDQESGTSGLVTAHGRGEATTGDYKDTVNHSRKSSGEVETSDGYHGVGGTAAAPVSKSTTKETLLPNGDLYSEATETERVYGPNGLEVQESGTTAETTTHGKKLERSKVGEEKTATIGLDVDETEYGLTAEQTKEGKEIQEASGVDSEKTESKGSSPLRTYQALIQEELDGRSGAAWNFTELVKTDVMREIALTIWRKPRLIV